ncbi:MAG: DUF6383 domain-containing protein [Parabacteroides sp.]|nr:DUF6383 domain-containing protein [Parabacteroides sp.]
MNKKFSTLMALALLAGSFPVAAQFCTVNGEVPYHTRLVKAAALDANISGVKKINQEYYYQLQVNPASLATSAGVTPTGTFVLVAERDYSTGKIYLTAQEISKATLTHSLWKIKETARSANGRVFTYVNKETGYELAFDHTNALVLNHGAGEDVLFSGANKGWTYENDGLTDGCNDHWVWYTTDDNGTAELNYKKVYSYFHNGTDSVMALRAARRSANIEDVAKAVYDAARADGSKVVDVLSENGLDGTATGGYAIVAVKDSKGNAQDWLDNVSKALEIKPVVAGAKVLNFAEINSMIDADGSYLTFGQNGSQYIKNYGDWLDAKEVDKAGKFAKFTVLKPGTNEPLNVVDGANPFAHAFTDGKFVAEAYYENLARNNYDATSKTITNATGNQYAGYDILLRTKDAIQQVGGEKQYGYLYVSEHTYEPKTATSNHDGLQVKIQPYSYLSNGAAGGDRKIVKEIDRGAAYITDGYPDALEARYHWKVTYYATNDSLVLEPLNASRMNTKEMAAETPFEKTHLATEFSEKWVNTVNAATTYNSNTSTDGNWMSDKKEGIPVALFAMNNSQVGDEAQLLTIGTPKNAEAAEANYAAQCKGNGNPAYVTNQVNLDSPYQADMNLRLKFNHGYTYLTRATMASGVYFMNLATNKYSTAQTEHRVNGANLVADMGGHVVYDVEEQGQQDFNHMPATQWVVEQQPCLKGDDVNANENPTVRIYNREYADQLFGGQLYTAGDGKFFTINHREYGWLANQQNVDRHYRKTYNCADTVTFAPVDVNELGYFNETDENLRNTTYMFQHMYDMNAGKFLTVSDKNNNVRVGDTGTSFELFRSEGWVPVRDTYQKYDEATGTWVTDKADTYHFTYVKEQEYGYASEAAKATQLYKTFYKIKVKDANLIDNDHKFVAINNQYKYVVATEDEIMDPKNHLSFAIVSLKENNHLNDIHGYAIVNNPTYIKVNAKTDDDLKGLTLVPERDEYGNPYEAYYKGGKLMVKLAVDNSQIAGKLGVEAVSLDTKIDELCNTSTDAFALVSADRPLYATIASEYVNNNKKAIDLRTIERQGNESLFEDSSSKEAQRWSMNYLGAENMSKPTKNEGFYVDAVAKSMGTRMPQYLLAVAADSVPAYTYCNVTIDDRVNHGINHSCGHGEWFPGYVEGRFLINFNDSVQAAKIDKVTNADKFKSDNYTRLGFVEAVHRGDSLYVLKYPYTLASIKEEAKDGSGKLFINPLFLSEDSLGKVYDIVPLNGKHNNAVFSFRNTGDEDESFLIESNDAANKDGKPYSIYSKVGSFAGAWIKIHNNVPVLAKYYSNDGNHNTGDFTDDWVAVGDKTDDNVTGEFINQGARFVFNAIDKDSQATANENIAASSVVVAGTNGAVVVKGAEGKNVIVSTILGKVVANETVSSDNATIAAPQGVVVVSVDGESFKVVVK